MGHFSMTCSASGLPITGGTKVRALLLTKSPYEDDTRKAWVVRTLPIRATYNDYGTIEDIHKGDDHIAAQWLRGLKEDLVELGLGDNSVHDTATSKDMEFFQLLEALRSHRVFVRQDTKHFWRRPHDGSFLDKAPLPMYQVICNVLTAAGYPLSNDHDSAKALVVDEPVPNMTRVRFGRYEHGKEHLEALEAAKAAIEAAGYVASVVAGSGRYADDADVLVAHPPKEGQHFKGPQWDMKDDEDKRLPVRLAMVREDVWQAMVAYPRDSYVDLDCTVCGQSPSYHNIDGNNRPCPFKSVNKAPYKSHKRGTVYTHGPVFPKGVPHVLEKRGYSEYVWFGLEAFKYEAQRQWIQILEEFEKKATRDDLAGGLLLTKKEFPTAEDEAAVKKVRASIKRIREKEEARIAALSEEEQAKEKEAAAAQEAAWAAEAKDRVENPVFGDFLIGYAYTNRGDSPVGEFFTNGLPGVINITDHFSMYLADCKKPTVDMAWFNPAHAVDTLAELHAFEWAMHEVGSVWKPAASTGPQDPSGTSTSGS